MSQMTTFIETINLGLIADWLANGIGVIAALIVLIGVFEGIVYMLKALFTRQTLDFACVRLILGQYLLLALEFLIGKDILETIVYPSLNELAQLGVLIIIRVVLNYFLVLDIAGKEKYIQKMVGRVKK